MRRIALNFDRDALAVMLILGVIAMGTAASTAFSTRATANPVSTARAEPAPPAPMPVNSDGGLVLRSIGGVAKDVPAMRLGTDIVADVDGQTARVTVTQAFRNTSDQWMEATYLYPLPDNGAVDTLKMVVGDRIFEGRIKPKEEAREIYEEAKANGQKAGLVEQHRPNMFRNSIANVGPGETVLVQIEFQAPIQQVAGDYSLRMPLVVGPRYIAGSAKDGGSLSRAALLAGASDIVAPTADPDMVARAGGGLNPVSITVNLDPGFTADTISSPYHAVNVAGQGATRTITLADGAVPANRDFELRWSAAGDAPSVGLFREKHGELDYVMATITPPSAERTGAVPPREMIFVIDNSGSMAGESMPAARRSLLYALETLRPQDSFNIIRFDDTMTELFEYPVPANRRNLEQAKSFTHALEAEGGTEMLPALRAALDPCGDAKPVTAADCAAEQAAEADRVRQVIFLTDGSLSNEAEMMAEISQNRGRSRVFMVGIGSAPNTFLMRRMAEAGRGTFTHVGMGEEAESQMQRLLDRLARPVATNLTATVNGGNIDFAPRDLPDLYAGEPLVLLGRTRHLQGTLTVNGLIEGRRWSQTIDLSQGSQSDVVAKLWAYRRIAEVEAERWSGETSYERADESIEELGMAFHLVTSRTSLIAVDDTPSRPEGATLTREELPLLLPAGWDFDHLFGVQFANRDRDLPMREMEKQRQQLELPETSTGYVLTLGLGLLLLLAGLAMAVGHRWERLRSALLLRSLHSQVA
ncbi:marine proteobacterial sortase target protein [Erythrobacter aurantius]|uniref:marine proteobacterial sortase target protein n=1 Tax=Erythrobacter aurantius TaxID=2909249 RepID=UPI0020799F21|nr:marine proteobacterial sortase target protein [Erythrobacter aurantius]